MYETPKLERFGAFRDLTRWWSWWNYFHTHYNGCGHSRS